ncbi:uncharacterized protein MYCFIDRAFT_180678 [Pseudocercospora fijiensis CIRAD86]|uniref:Uncharacterized protein n=1 Tax=Pseudocercospora fijiensis (strain CIRAD86) TaxID=383855 RepID=M3AH14_PSEFD|nr:uncharacterized protein MYCFIDRAFT_180678 [Pseudocercospora fijiensis CIRAD86]EME76777.1 hypothetical protein MYCFIDRAFT_180678 [Pseudocercospora fijiensis CIRAD86]
MSIRSTNASSKTCFTTAFLRVRHDSRSEQSPLLRPEQNYRLVHASGRQPHAPLTHGSQADSPAPGRPDPECLSPWNSFPSVVAATPRDLQVLVMARVQHGDALVRHIVGFAYIVKVGADEVEEVMSPFSQRPSFLFIRVTFHPSPPNGYLAKVAASCFSSPGTVCAQAKVDGCQRVGKLRFADAAEARPKPTGAWSATMGFHSTTGMIRSGAQMTDDERWILPSSGSPDFVKHPRVDEPKPTGASHGQARINEGASDHRASQKNTKEQGRRRMKELQATKPISVHGKAVLPKQKLCRPKRSSRKRNERPWNLPIHSAHSSISEEHVSNGPPVDAVKMMVAVLAMLVILWIFSHTLINEVMYAADTHFPRSELGAALVQRHSGLLTNTVCQVDTTRCNEACAA